MLGGKREREKKNTICNTYCFSTTTMVARTRLNVMLYIICYMSPDGNFDEFLHILELVICKVQSRGTNLFLCGDWNVNFLQRSTKLSELQNLLLMYNLVNMVKPPQELHIILVH
jgi:hypothetical protein